MTKTGQTWGGQDSPTAFFMDIGCWQTPDDNGRAMTTFGLVSGPYILLCSWLKIHKKEQNGKRIWESDFIDAIMRKDNASIPPPIEKFLYGAGKKERGFIHKWAEAPMPLTDPKELLIFVGDLHLHLYTGDYVDRFQYKKTKDSNWESLDLELRMLLDHADAMIKTHKFDVKTIQTGDMYEIWETEIILREQYLKTLQLWSDNKEILISSKYMRKAFTIIRDLIEAGKVLIDFPFLDSNGRILQNSELRHVDKHIVENEGINFRDTDNICKEIRKKHPILFKGKDKLFKDKLFTKEHELRGNHDNFKANSYWPEVSPEKYRNNPLDEKEKNFLKSKTEGATGKHPFGKLIGSQKIIWAEHGHVYDWHNNNEDWCLGDQHGFEMVHGVVSGTDSGLLDDSIWKQAFPFMNKYFWITVLNQTKKEGGYVAPHVGSLWPDLWDYEMRLPEIRRADEIFGEQKMLFYLVVMGHTHEPDLITGRRSELFLNKDIFKEYTNYLKRKYYKEKG